MKAARTDPIINAVSLTSLRLFVTIAEECSLTRAAKRENLVLPAVSKRIKELETILGAQLLYRSSRGVALTPAGFSLLTHARQMMRSLARLRSAVAKYSDGVEGSVRVYVTTASVTQYLPDELSAFLRKNPQIRIDLKDGSSAAIVRALLEGAADVGIVDSRAALQGLETLLYRQHRLMLVVRPGHPLARLKSVKLEDVVEHDLVGTPGNSSLHALLVRTAAEAGLTLKLRMQLRGLDGICRMIKAGLGVGILPAPAVKDNVRSMRLAAIPIEGEWASRTSLVCFRKLAGLSPAARMLARHLSDPRRA